MGRVLGLPGASPKETGVGETTGDDVAEVTGFSRGGDPGGVVLLFGKPVDASLSDLDGVDGCTRTPGASGCGVADAERGRDSATGVIGWLAASDLTGV